MSLLDLPLEQLEEIFKFLSYDEIAKNRIVCVKFNRIGQNLLNRGFIMLTKIHSKKLKQIKGLLPRRESERRTHKLANHISILTCIETRMSMVSMAYNRYINLGLCCFIPGKFIDEVLIALRKVGSNAELFGIQDLQELRDISVMAVEHFNDNIVNSLKYSNFNAQRLSYSAGTTVVPVAVKLPTTTTTPPIEPSRPSECKESQKNTLALLGMEGRYKTAIKKMRQMCYIQKKQQQLMKANNSKINNLTTEMVELKRRIEDLTAQNRKLITATSTSFNMNSFKKLPEKPMNIKPRAATIILKRIGLPKQFGDIKKTKPNED